MTETETILHVDMDAFYASVEVKKDPSLQGKPVIVGGHGGRGVVTSASYEARAFGVTSAMPSITARRLCPHGIFLPNDFEAYQEHSRLIRDVFLSFSPVVEPLSLDEAFVDVAGSVKLLGPPLEIARALKERIRALGLGCTVAIAPNKFLAKLGSRVAKPDGLLLVPAGEAKAWLHPQPVTALWGVGAHTGEVLRRLGLATIGDVAKVSKRTLERALGEALGAHLHDLANGIDDRPVIPWEAPKSVGSEETFSTDLDADPAVLREILRLSDRTATRLRAKGLCGRTVTLKIRWSSFKTITRSKTVAEEIDTAADIYHIARGLYQSLPASERARIRLLGVTVSGVSEGPPRRQLDLLRSDRRGWDEVAVALDSIRARFGERSVTPATLLDDPGLDP